MIGLHASVCNSTFLAENIKQTLPNDLNTKRRFSLGIMIAWQNAQDSVYLAVGTVQDLNAVIGQGEYWGDLSKMALSKAAVLAQWAPDLRQ